MSSFQLSAIDIIWSILLWLSLLLHHQKCQVTAIQSKCTGIRAAVGLMTVMIFGFICLLPVNFNTKSQQHLNAESQEGLSDETYHINLEQTPEKKLLGESRPKTVLFFNPANYQLVRNVLQTSFFHNCEVKNCEMVFDKNKLNETDAVIIHTKYLTKLPCTQRRKGQIWIMIHHESPMVYQKKIWIWKNQFNWTMTYSRYSDIHLPCGRLVLKKSNEDIKRNYESIAANKSKDALWIASHCPTKSQREKYVEILKKYIRVDIFGRCGKRWDCGMRYNHSSGNCFDILNSTYRFYLAFENALCDEYITEKFYENYNYDIIQVVRGGRPNTNPLYVSNNVFINANDFKNAHELGKYLKALSKNPSKYATILKEKDKYENVPYMELFQQAACNICKRLHNVNNYRSVYADIRDWMAAKERCYQPNDM